MKIKIVGSSLLFVCILALPIAGQHTIPSSREPHETVCASEDLTKTLLDRLKQLEAIVSAQQKEIEYLRSLHKETALAGNKPAAAGRGENSQLASSVTRQQTEQVKGQINTPLPAWLGRFQLSGDLRYRVETIELGSSPLRHRHRIRARFRATTQVTDSLDAVLQFASGTDDPVSTNQDLGDAFSTKPLRLDMAYFRFQPALRNLPAIFAGKMSYPYFRPGQSQLIWDDDLRMEGLAISGERAAETMRLFYSFGAFVPEERKQAKDTWLFGPQAGVEFKNDALNVVVGASGYQFTNLKGMPLLFDPQDSFGNSVSPSGTYASDFHLVEVFAQATVRMKLPVQLFADYVKNTAVSRNGLAYLTGVRLGKARKARDWFLQYDYRFIEPDAVIGIFNDSDFVGGGTDGKGHTIRGGYQLTDRYQIGFTYFINEKGLGTRTAFRRLMLDFSARF